MSFRCQGCKKVNRKPTRIVTKTREHEHVELREGEFGNPVPMIVGVGPQIVQEKILCSGCVA
jgi:hypothetical protein